MQLRVYILIQMIKKLIKGILILFGAGIVWLFIIGAMWFGCALNDQCYEKNKRGNYETERTN